MANSASFDPFKKFIDINPSGAPTQNALNNSFDNSIAINAVVDQEINSLLNNANNNNFINLSDNDREFLINVLYSIDEDDDGIVDEKEIQHLTSLKDDDDDGAMITKEDLAVFAQEVAFEKLETDYIAQMDDLITRYFSGRELANITDEEIQKAMLIDQLVSQTANKEEQFAQYTNSEGWIDAGYNGVKFITGLGLDKWDIEQLIQNEKAMNDMLIQALQDGSVLADEIPSDVLEMQLQKADSMEDAIFYLENVSGMSKEEVAEFIELSINGYEYDSGLSSDGYKYINPGSYWRDVIVDEEGKYGVLDENGNFSTPWISEYNNDADLLFEKVIKNIPGYIAQSEDLELSFKQIYALYTGVEYNQEAIARVNESAIPYEYAMNLTSAAEYQEQLFESAQTPMQIVQYFQKLHDCSQADAIEYFNNYYAQIFEQGQNDREFYYANILPAEMQSNCPILEFSSFCINPDGTSIAFEQQVSPKFMQGLQYDDMKIFVENLDKAGLTFYESDSTERITCGYPDYISYDENDEPEYFINSAGKICNVAIDENGEYVFDENNIAKDAPDDVKEQYNQAYYETFINSKSEAPKIFDAHDYNDFEYDAETGLYIGSSKLDGYYTTFDPYTGTLTEIRPIHQSGVFDDGASKIFEHINISMNSSDYLVNKTITEFDSEYGDGKYEEIIETHLANCKEAYGENILTEKIDAYMGDMDSYSSTISTIMSSAGFVISFVPGCQWAGMLALGGAFVDNGIDLINLATNNLDDEFKPWVIQFSKDVALVGAGMGLGAAAGSVGNKFLSVLINRGVNSRAAHVLGTATEYILDVGSGFGFDCAMSYLETGDLNIKSNLFSNLIFGSADIKGGIGAYKAFKGGSIDIDLGSGARYSHDSYTKTDIINYKDGARYVCDANGNRTFTIDGKTYDITADDYSAKGITYTDDSGVTYRYNTRTGETSIIEINLKSQESAKTSNDNPAAAKGAVSDSGKSSHQEIIEQQNLREDGDSYKETALDFDDVSKQDLSEKNTQESFDKFLNSIKENETVQKLIDDGKLSLTPDIIDEYQLKDFSKLEEIFSSEGVLRAMENGEISSDFVYHLAGCSDDIVKGVTNCLNAGKKLNEKIINDIPRIRKIVQDPELASKIIDLQVLHKVQVDLYSFYFKTENKHPDLDYINDINKMHDAKTNGKNILDVIAPKYLTMDDAITNSAVGDTFEIDGRLYIKESSGEILELNMTREKYFELFPPLARWDVHQNKAGDCYLLSALFGMYKNPNTRSRILSCFTQNPDGSLDVKLPKGEITLKFNPNEKALDKTSSSFAKVNEQNEITEVLGDGVQTKFNASGAEGFKELEVLFGYEATNIIMKVMQGTATPEQIKLCEDLGSSEFLMGELKPFLDAADKDIDKILLESSATARGNGGIPDDIMGLFGFSPEIISAKDFLDFIENSNFDENDIFVISTLGEFPQPDGARAYNLYAGHGYTFKIDKGANGEMKTCLYNPHDTSSRIDIPIDKIPEYFNYIFIGR